MEVAEVRQDVLFVIRRLGVLSEFFCQPLGDHGGRADVFRLGEESGCPDSVAFFKWFIWEVGLRVRRLLECQFGFVFLISIFYEGWEGAGPAGVYPFSVLPLCVPFRLVFGSPVTGPEKDRDWTGLGPLRTGNYRTAQDRNRSPSPFRKFQDRTKTGLDQSGPVFVVGIFY